MCREVPIKEEKESLWANQLLPAHSKTSPKRFVVLPPMHILKATAYVRRSADSNAHTPTGLAKETLKHVSKSTSTQVST